MGKWLNHLGDMFENMFGDGYPEYEEESVADQEQEKQIVDENKSPEAKTRHENLIIRSLRKVIGNLFDGAGAEPVSVKEWTIALSIIFALTFGGMFLMDYFDIKGYHYSNTQEESYFGQDSVLKQISKNRYLSLKRLTDRFTNMHLDDAVTDDYNEANEIMKNLNSSGDDYFTISAKSYYSAGIVFAGATYVPSFFSLFYDSTTNASVQSNDSVVAFQNMPIFKIWQERSRHLSLLKNHYQQFSDAYEQKNKQDYIILCAQLKLDFIKAIDFYTRVIIPQLNAESFINKQLAAYQKCERTIADTSTDFGTRYFALTSFMEKLHFNALSTLYIQYAGESGDLFDPSFLFSSAAKMDSILTFDKNTTSKDVFHQLQESSAVILSFTDSTMALLDKAIKAPKVTKVSKVSKVTKVESELKLKNFSHFSSLTNL